MITIFLSLIQLLTVINILIVSKLRDKKFISLVSSISVIWLIHSFLANSGVTGFYLLSEKTNILITIFLIGILIAVFLAPRAKNTTFSLNIKFRTLYPEKCAIRILFTLILLSFFVITIYITKKSINFQTLRDIIYSGNNSYISIIIPITWIITGLLFYLFLFSFYSFIAGKMTKWYFIISMINIILFNLLSGGRTSIIYLLIMLISAWILLSKHASTTVNTAKVNKLIKRSTYLLLIMIIFITLFRSNGSIYSIIVTYNKYFIGSFVAMSEFIKTHNMDLEDIRIGYSIMGLDTFVISGIFRFILNVDIPSILSQVSGAMHYGVYISNDTITNAHYTILTSFYWDFGYLGALIIGFLLPTLYFFYLRKFYIYHDFLSFSLCNFLVLITIYSIRTNVLLEPHFFIMLLFIFIRTKFIR